MPSTVLSWCYILAFYTSICSFTLFSMLSLWFLSAVWLLLDCTCWNRHDFQGIFLTFSLYLAYPIVGFLNNQMFCANITWFFNLLQIFTLSPKKSTNFQLMLRFTQGVTALGLIAALALVVVFTDLSVPDLFACILAFIPTGWTIISVSDFMTFFGCWSLSSIFWIYTTLYIRGCCGLTKSECPSEWFCYKSDGIIFQIC